MVARNARGVDFIDIRRDKVDDTILETVLSGLHPEVGKEKSLPTLLLYDERGLRLFERVTYLDEYYLTNTEIGVLEACADSIVQRLPHDCRLIELGSGNLRKVEILLQAFEKASKHAEYYALDLSIAELGRTFANIATEDYKFVEFFALHGTYDDGLAWLSDSDKKPTVIMSLGSSIGNFDRLGAADFLRSFTEALGPHDRLLIGLDACQDEEKVFKAYNDSEGMTEWFYRNGLDHANILIGRQLFQQSDWNVEGRYDSKEHKHYACYVAKQDIYIDDALIKAGEKLKFEESYKYNEAESDPLWREAGLVLQHSYGNEDRSYNIHLLAPAAVTLPKNATEYAGSHQPSLQDWHELWRVWDIATRSMIPREELLDKPIKLRNSLIFYLGHIPAFADIHMTRATMGKPTEPAYYHQIFERGIDPDVDNPEQCHAHSEIPDEWPPLVDMLDYQSRIRDRVISLIESGTAAKDRKIARALTLAYEHEGMHLETFFYMLLQSERVLPPPAVPMPDFPKLAASARARRVKNEWHSVPASTIMIGTDDAENDFPPDRYFVWDIERPSRTVQVSKFEAQSRPISNGEYAYFLEQSHAKGLPASWTNQIYQNGVNGVMTNGISNGVYTGALGMPSHEFMNGKAVRTVFGQVPLKYVLDWPVMASYDELTAFATWSGGRIPSLEEARSIYNYADSQKSKLEKLSSTLISAVNGHLCNEGVEETPPSKSLSNGHREAAPASVKQVESGNGFGLDPSHLFINLEKDCNVGFANWHPTPITHRTDLAGQCAMGGLWEWTSTPLFAHPGYKPMDLYPAYSSDFFDDKHNICLGGSWATIPRIAGRKTFVNWYQRNYPYAWCTARLVRDIPE